MNSTKIRSHTVVVWYRVVVTLGAWIDAVLDNASVEFLVLFFDQMHCFTVGNPPERGASYWPTEIPKTCVEGGFLITGLEMRIRVHVPVIPTVARPKNIMGSRPYKLSD